MLANSDHQLDLVVTESGAKVLEVEEGVKLTGVAGADYGELSRWLDHDMASPQWLPMAPRRRTWRLTSPAVLATSTEC